MHRLVASNQNAHPCIMHKVGVNTDTDYHRKATPRQFERSSL